MTNSRVQTGQITKDISIITVTWNCKRYVQEFLASIRDMNKDPKVETIVVDNASADGTCDLIRQAYPEVKVIESGENLGFSRGNNVGLRLAQGEYICLINPDVQVTAGCIEKMRVQMEQNPSIGLLGPRMLDGDGVPSRSYMGEPTLWRMLCRALALDVIFPKWRTMGGFLMPYFDQTRTADVDILNGWFWMVRRNALMDVGLLDESLFMYADDLDWSKRFRNKGWRVVYFPEAESIHYGAGASSNSPIRFSVEMQKANFQYWQKNYGKMSQVLYRSIMSVHHIVRLGAYCIVLATVRNSRQEHRLKIKRSMACLKWAIGR